MPGIKKHIALLLFGIFFFPLVYQPYHVLKHHSQKVHCHHDCCHSEIDKQICSSSPQINSAAEKEEPCPICDYHFPINILPKVFVYQSNTTLGESAIIELKIRIPYQQVVSLKSPRAPPALKS